MKLTVEISKYPLADDYIGPIKGFIDELCQLLAGNEGSRK